MNKIIILIALSVVIGCHNGSDQSPKNIIAKSANVTLEINGVGTAACTVYEFEYKGHTYVSTDALNLTHAGHCKCNPQANQ